MYLGPSIVYSTANAVPVAANINNHHPTLTDRKNSEIKQQHLQPGKPNQDQTSIQSNHTTISMGNSQSNKTHDFNTRELNIFFLFIKNLLIFFIYCHCVIKIEAFINITIEFTHQLKSASIVDQL